jgi:hypothetical protein
MLLNIRVFSANQIVLVRLPSIKHHILTNANDNCVLLYGVEEGLSEGQHTRNSSTVDVDISQR